MAEFQHIIGSILKDISKARVSSDAYVRGVSEIYEQNESLRFFPVPRTEIDQVALDLHFAIGALNEIALSDAQQANIATSIEQKIIAILEETMKFLGLPKELATTFYEQLSAEDKAIFIQGEVPHHGNTSASVNTPPVEGSHTPYDYIPVYLPLFLDNHYLWIINTTGTSIEVMEGKVHQVHNALTTAMSQIETELRVVVYAILEAMRVPAVTSASDAAKIEGAKETIYGKVMEKLLRKASRTDDFQITMEIDVLFNIIEREIKALSITFDTLNENALTAAINAQHVEITSIEDQIQQAMASVIADNLPGQILDSIAQFIAQMQALVSQSNYLKSHYATQSEMQTAMVKNYRDFLLTPILHPYRENVSDFMKNSFFDHRPNQFEAGIHHFFHHQGENLIRQMYYQIEEIKDPLEDYQVDIQITNEELLSLPSHVRSSVKVDASIQNYVWSQSEAADGSKINHLIAE